jgi:hypothetical protein
MVAYVSPNAFRNLFIAKPLRRPCEDLRLLLGERLRQLHTFKPGMEGFKSATRTTTIHRYPRLLWYLFTLEETRTDTLI